MRVPGGDVLHRTGGVRARSTSGSGAWDDSAVLVEVHNDTSVPVALAMVLRPLALDGPGRLPEVEVQGQVVRIGGRVALVLSRAVTRVAAGPLGQVADQLAAGHDRTPARRSCRWATTAARWRWWCRCPTTPPSASCCHGSPSVVVGAASSAWAPRRRSTRRGRRRRTGAGRPRRRVVPPHRGPRPGRPGRTAARPAPGGGAARAGAQRHRRLPGPGERGGPGVRAARPQRRGRAARAPGPGAGELQRLGGAVAPTTAAMRPPRCCSPRRPLLASGSEALGGAARRPVAKSVHLPARRSRAVGPARRALVEALALVAGPLPGRPAGGGRRRRRGRSGARPASTDAAPPVDDVPTEHHATADTLGRPWPCARRCGPRRRSTDARQCRRRRAVGPGSATGRRSADERPLRRAPARRPASGPRPCARSRPALAALDLGLVGRTRTGRAAAVWPDAWWGRRWRCTTWSPRTACCRSVALARRAPGAAVGDRAGARHRRTHPCPAGRLPGPGSALAAARVAWRRAARRGRAGGPAAIPSRSGTFPAPDRRCVDLPGDAPAKASPSSEPSGARRASVAGSVTSPAVARAAAAHRQRLEAAEREAGPVARSPPSPSAASSSVDVRGALEQLAEDDLALGPGQVRPEAVVRAPAEAQRLRRVGRSANRRDVEALGLVVGRRRRGCRCPGARRTRCRAGGAPRTARRRSSAKRMFSCTGESWRSISTIAEPISCGVRAQQGHLVRVRQQQPQTVADQVRRRLEAGGVQQDRVGDAAPRARADRLRPRPRSARSSSRSSGAAAWPRPAPTKYIASSIAAARRPAVVVVVRRRVDQRGERRGPWGGCARCRRGGRRAAR